MNTLSQLLVVGLLTAFHFQSSDLLADAEVSIDDIRIAWEQMASKSTTFMVKWDVTTFRKSDVVGAVPVDGDRFVDTETFTMDGDLKRRHQIFGSIRLPLLVCFPPHSGCECAIRNRCFC